MATLAATWAHSAFLSLSVRDSSAHKNGAFECFIHTHHSQRCLSKHGYNFCTTFKMICFWLQLLKHAFQTTPVCLVYLQWANVPPLLHQRARHSGSGCWTSVFGRYQDLFTFQMLCRANQDTKHLRKWIYNCTEICKNATWWIASGSWSVSQSKLELSKAADSLEQRTGQM